MVLKENEDLQNDVPLKFLRYGYPCEANYQSQLARILYNTAKNNIAEQLVLSCCDIIENMYLESYEVINTSSGEIELRSTGGTLSFCPTKSTLYTGKIYGLRYNNIRAEEANLLCFDGVYYGIERDGEIIATCYAPMLLSAMSECLGTLLVVSDIKYQESPFAVDDKSIFDYVVNSTVFDHDDACREDLRYAVKSLLKLKHTGKAKGLSVFVDGLYLPLSGDKSHIALEG